MENPEKGPSQKVTIPKRDDPKKVNKGIAPKRTSTEKDTVLKRAGTEKGQH